MKVALSRGSLLLSMLQNIEIISLWKENCRAHGFIYEVTQFFFSKDGNSLSSVVVLFKVVDTVIMWKGIIQPKKKCGKGMMDSILSFKKKKIRSFTMQF